MRPRYYAYDPEPGVPRSNLAHEAHRLRVVSIVTGPLRHRREVIQLGLDIGQVVMAGHHVILLSLRAFQAPVPAFAGRFDGRSLRMAGSAASRPNRRPRASRRAARSRWP